MKHIFKKNQIIITTLAIMIAVAGYLNYSGTAINDEQIAEEANSDVIVDDIDVSDISDEDAYVQTQNTLTQSGAAVGTEEEANETSLTDIESLDSDVRDVDTEASTGNPGEAVLTATNSLEIIEQAKLTREQTRAQNKEALLELINNTNIADTQKQEAIQSMIDLTDVSEKESAAEILLEAKGFSEVVVSIQDGKADIVVNLSTIDDAQRAQIEDIVKRKTGISGENIVITPITAQ